MAFPLKAYSSLLLHSRMSLISHMQLHPLSLVCVLSVETVKFLPNMKSGGNDPKSPGSGAACRVTRTLVPIPKLFFSTSSLTSPCSNITAMTLLQWHYYIDIAETILLQWHYWSDMAAAVLLQLHYCSDITAVILLPCHYCSDITAVTILKGH